MVAPGPDVLPALRDALAGGPALFVSAEGASDLPATVEQRVAVVIETSGSTGKPKRVMLSADAVLASAAASESAVGGPGQWVRALPTYYIAGLNVLVRSIAAGIEPIQTTGHFDARAIAKIESESTHPVRYTAVVPAQLAGLLENPMAVEHLRGYSRVLVGGQGMPPALRERALAAGIRITRTYGSSETSGGCVYDGEPIGQTTVRIAEGEVWVGGPTLAEGYLADDERTADRFVVADGTRWYRTNDEGTWDGEHLRVTGRLDDVIISGGIKVALGAVEDIIRGVDEAAVVVGGFHERWGEVPVIVTTSGTDFTDAIATVGRRLGAPARPARIIRLDIWPVLPSGKVDRVALTALAARAAD
jgi:O-succinylbenzoic acid--CoA ligase